MYGQWNKFMQNFFEDYIQSISSKFSHEETSEMGYRTDFEILIKGIFESINVKRVDHDAKATQGNKPDFIVLNHDVPILYIEAKDIGTSLDKVEKSEQMARYYGYTNLVLTDYVEFRFYRNGVRYEDPIKIANYDIKNRTISPSPENYKYVAKTLVDFANCKFISESEHDELIKRCNPEFEDIVVAKSGTTGVATLVDTKEKFSLFVSVALLKLNKKVVDPKFVVFYLNSKLGKKQMLDRTKGGTIKNLHIEEIREITIPFPSFTEQQKIVEKLEVVQNYKKLLLKQKSLLKELFDSILDKSMKGELDS